MEAQSRSAICCETRVSKGGINLEKQSIYFKRIEDDIQLDSVLSANGMIDFARIRQRHKD